MSQTIERQQGAVRFTKPKRQRTLPSGAVLFTKPDLDGFDDAWEMIIQTAMSYKSLDDDWDGNHSIAPDPELVDMAVILARHLKGSANPAPARVVAGVNGTISFEFGDEPFLEIEVVSPSEAEVYESGKLVQILTADEEL